MSQFDLNNKMIKDLIVVCNNNTKWNFACNIIEQAL